MRRRLVCSLPLLLLALTACGSSSGGSSGGGPGVSPGGAVAYYTTAYGGSMSIALWSTTPNCQSGGTPTGGATVLLLVVPGNPVVAKAYSFSGTDNNKAPHGTWEEPT